MKFPKYNINALLYACLVSSLMVISNSCGDDDDTSTGEIKLNSFGPSFLMRGEQLRFIGTNLDQVTTIVLPDNIEITTFITKTPELLIIEVPKETVDGKVTLKTPQGDLQTITDLVISEPITIASITPAEVRPGEKVIIKGTYLNLVVGISFNENKVVTEFERQSETEIEVVVPDNAQSGKVVLSDDQEIPNLIESPIELVVSLPAVSSITSLPVKAGNTITLSGTNLDLTEGITFPGGTLVEAADFESITATEIVLKVPDNAKEGKLKLYPLSKVEVESPTLTLVAPTITTVNPSAAKNNGSITVTGTDLDLINRVTFGGGKQGSIQSGGTSTQITVGVPADAIDGKVKFGTQADKWDSTQSITLVVPTITSFAAASVQTATQPSITINGTHLDLVSGVMFAGEWESKAITVNSANQIVVKVKPGSVSGKFTMITTNGTEIQSDTELTIVPDMPTVTSITPTSFTLGQVLTLTAASGMDVPFDVIFPGGVTAVTYTSKTATTIKVTVPIGAKSGRIKLVNYANEIYEIPIDVKLAGTEPIVDPALIINNFDESGHDLGWDNWGGNVELGNDAGQALSGKYLHGTKADATGWTWIWGCNHSQLPKPSVTKADHVLKIDIKITTAIPANANFQIKLNGTDIDLGNLGGTTLGDDWATITYDLSTFGNLPATIGNTGDWGMILQAGTVDLTGVYIDNIRFQAK
jgi:hypothetical protein